MKKSILLLILSSAICRLTALAQQQPYAGGESALGLRFGGASGVTYKKFSSATSAYELIGGYDFNNEIQGPSLTALFEDLPALSGKRLNAMIGAGPTVAFTNWKIGLSGIIGLDWRMGKGPINLQVDWLPTFFFVNETDFSLTNGAVSVRYLINHRKLYPKP